MITKKPNQSVLYKERLHKPLLSSEFKKLDNPNDQLIEKIDSDCELLIKNSAEQQMLLNQNVDLIKTIKDENSVFFIEMKNILNQNINDVLQIINISNTNIIQSIENLSKRVDLLMTKLSEFDVVEDQEEGQEEVPKDWISDDEVDESFPNNKIKEHEKPLKDEEGDKDVNIDIDSDGD